MKKHEIFVAASISVSIYSSLGNILQLQQWPACLPACMPGLLLDFIPSKVPLQLAHSFGTKEYHRKGREVHHHQLCPPLRSDVDTPIGEFLRICQNPRYIAWPAYHSQGHLHFSIPMPPLKLLQCQCSLRVFGVTTYLIRLDFISPVNYFLRGTSLSSSGRGRLQEDGFVSPPVCRLHHRWNCGHSIHTALMLKLSLA